MPAMIAVVRSRSAALRVVGVILMSVATAAACADEIGVGPMYKDQADTKAVEPGAVPPMQPPKVFTPPLEDSAPVRVEQPAGRSSVRQWYESQDRPAVAMYFLQRLGRVPPGWYGKYRVVIAGSKDDDWDNQHDGGKERGKETSNETLSIGVERNTADDGTRSRSPADGMVESVLMQQLQAANFRLVDTGLVERALVARRGRGGDHEYDALAAAARLMLEVEIVGVDDPFLMATLKSLKSGDVLAIARVPVNDRLASSGGVQSLARSLVRKLGQTPISLPDSSTLQ